MSDMEVTDEELQEELEEMKSSDRISKYNKRLDKKIKHRVSTKKVLASFLILSLILCFFVFISSIYQQNGPNGYLIKVHDIGHYEPGKYEPEGLELGFSKDVTEKPDYNQLIGKGYGDTSDVVGGQGLNGGSLLSMLDSTTSMYDKFKDLAENKDEADKYEGNEGSSNFDQYYANKFYLRNNGNEPINYRINLQIEQNLKGALHAARFMFTNEITNKDGSKDYEYRVFATPNKETGKGEIAAWAEQITATSDKIYFRDPNRGSLQQSSPKLEDAWICENLVQDPKTTFWHYYTCETDEKTGEVTSGEMMTIEPGQSICYTFCVWFEGSDPEHNNSILGGGIDFSINFETEKLLKYIADENNKRENN